MKSPFPKSLKGKFVLRTVLIAIAVAAVIGGLAIFSMRSLSATATTSVNNARSADAETLAALEALADDVSSTSSSLTMMVAIAAVFMVLVAGVFALMFARKVSTPVVLLRNAAQASTAVLPEIAEASTAGADLPALPTIALASGDELQDLADAIDHLQRTAAELAIAEPQVVTQPQDDHMTMAKLRVLGARSQGLLRQQMDLIEGIQRDQTNPANLQDLSQIDHLATRMRRAAESFLVLADTPAARPPSRPASMQQVVQAASHEIEHADRISISDLSGVAVAGAAATDVAHLLAELLENATVFAPADAITTVSGRPTDHGYLIDIIDHGAGMAPEAIAVANTRLKSATVTTEDASTGIGHEIVARLAQRHRIALRLSATPTGGLTAQVHIPQAALASVAEPELQPVIEHAAPAEVTAAPAAIEHAASAEVTAAPAVTQDSVIEVREPATVAVASAPSHDTIADLESAPTAPTPPPTDGDPITDHESAPTAPTPPPTDGEPEPTSGLTREQQAAIDWAINQTSVPA